MERLLCQPMNTSSSIESDEVNSYLSVIPVILNTYVTDVPKMHEKLLESIPQQAILFYNNCMFLAHWVAKNAETDIPTHPALVKTLQATGTSVFKAQILHQQNILVQILREFGMLNLYFYGDCCFFFFFFLKYFIILYNCRHE